MSLILILSLSVMQPIVPYGCAVVSAFDYKASEWCGTRPRGRLKGGTGAIGSEHKSRKRLESGLNENQMQSLTH